MSSSSNFRLNSIKPFDGRNFTSWKIRVQAELKAQKLLSYVTDKLPDPDKRIGEWLDKNNEACKVIIENLADTHLSYATNKDYAKSIWQALESHFERKSFMRLAYVKRKLGNLRYDNKTSLNNHINTFEELNAEKKAAGGTTSELESIADLIATLPEEFDPLVASLGEIGKGSITTFEAFRACLLDLDLKRNDNKKNHPTDTAFVAEKRNSKPKNGVATSSTRFPFNCNYCGIRGHMSKDCRKRKAETGDKKKDTKDKEKALVAFVVESSDSEVNTVKSGTQFALDSGATDHMCVDRALFTEFVELKTPTQISTADKEGSSKCTGIGTVKIGKFSLKNVEYVPNFRQNLLSVSRMVKR